MRILEDIKYGSEEQHLLDCYYPETKEFDVLIWFHGGGLESGNRKDIRFVEDLLNEGIAVVSVEYRMYPTAVFPEFIEDCATAVKYVLENIATREGSKRVFVSGQSAGAYITMMLALNEEYLHKAGVDRSRISGFISDSAQVTTHFNVLRERGFDTRVERIDDAAPMYYISEKFTGNLLMIYYEDDMPCRPEQNRLFYKSLQRFCPNHNIQIVELSGEHCNGSSNRNNDGMFDFNVELVKFINTIKGMGGKEND